MPLTETTLDPATAPASVHPPVEGNRRAVVLLVLGAVLGIGLAAAGLTKPSAGDAFLPLELVARVNGEGIRREDYERMLAALAGDRQGELAASEAQRVLDRLIDEELLVQRGIELGLANKDRRVRAEITSAMIGAVLSDLDDREPSRAEIEDFYQQNRDFFTRPGRLEVRQIFFRVANLNAEPDALRRAAEAEGRLQRGEDFAAVRDALGDRPPIDLPEAPLPPGKLRDYLGPTALRTALGLEVGELSRPVRSGTGIHLLEVVERLPDEAPELATIHTEVAAELRRRAGDRALRAYLDELRAGADVVVARSP
jgi:parvulin-like peptidyl-prolyl isomerase